MLTGTPGPQKALPQHVMQQGLSKELLTRKGGDERGYKVEEKTCLGNAGPSTDCDRGRAYRKEDNQTR
jgi:hypothetical protein